MGQASQFPIVTQLNELSSVCQAASWLCSTTTLCQDDGKFDDPSETDLLATVCTKYLIRAEADRDELLNETEYFTFVSDYVICSTTSKDDANLSFPEVLKSNRGKVVVNISEAYVSDDVRTSEERAALASICSSTTRIPCYDDKDTCSSSLLLSDKDYDGFLN
jgi:hypothetical protein